MKRITYSVPFQYFRLFVVAVFFLSVSTINNVFGQEAPVLEWAKATEGPGANNSALGVAVDAAGNVYTTGSFSETTDFDPGPSVFNLSPGAAGGPAAFIYKLDANSNFIWAKAIERTASSRSEGKSIAVTASGDVYITGDFILTADFDPGPAVFNLVAAGSNDDSFILKLDTNGNFVWAVRFGNTFLEYGNSIATDALGNVYAAGFFGGVVDFDPGPVIFNLTASGSNVNAYIVKLNSSGNWIWAKALGGTTASSSSLVQGMFVDAASNVHITGIFSGTVDFDPGLGSSTLTSTGGISFRNAFVTKLNSDGDLVWAKALGGTSTVEAYGISVDPSGNVLTTGVFVNTLDLDPGAGVSPVTSVANSGDIFISKLDINGNFVWGKGMGSNTVDHGRAIAADAAGNVYTTGFFYRTVDFDPGVGVFNLTALGGVNDDFFISKLDSNGDFVWALQTGGSNRDRGNAIHIDPAGSIYVGGFYSGSPAVDFDFGPCVLNLPGNDSFVEKITIGSVIPPAVITSFTPTVGPIGTTVTITGTNFSTTPADNVVKFFNNKTATVTASTATSITTTVPTGTITGTISVTTNCVTAVSATNFTIGAALPPSISSFTPTSGPIGTTVTITGTNFSATPASNIVFFGATQATVTAASATNLTVIVRVGATYQPITVLVNGSIAYSSKPFIVTFADGGIIDVCSFAPKVDLTPGTTPSSVAIGDLDGDGKADLAVANRLSASVSVFLNTSTGAGSISYAPKVDFTAGSNPLSVFIGDLDGDGKPDLAVANASSNTVSVLRNTSITGTISFAPKIDFATGSSPFSVAIGDLDGDGRADLAVANLNSNTVSVFRNTSTGAGSISYAAKVDFTTGSNPLWVHINDLDGDGKADLAVANRVANVSVLRNTSSGAGNISYAAKIDLTTSTQPVSVSIGDLDGDGKADLVVVNELSNNTSVLRNTSSIGSISYAAKVDFATESLPRSISIGDLDGDSKADLAVANNAGTISVFRNTSIGAGSISYAAKVDFTAGAYPFSVSIGDLDGDGKADLAVTNYDGNTVSLLRNTVSSLPPFTSSLFTPTSGPIGTVVTFTGTNFNSTPLNNTIKFNGVPAFVTASSSTSITAVVPTGATTGTVSIQIGCVTAFSIIPFTVTTSGLPTITSFTPINGPVGTTVTITGTNFSTTPANNLVAFNGTTAVVTASTTTSITTSVPTGATTGTITVTVAGNTATSATDFTVIASVPNQPPVINTTTTSTTIGGVVSINLIDLISDPDDNLVLGSLTIILSPASGASATLVNSVLEIDYTGINFSGRDQLTIQVCDASGECTQQVLEIEVIGDIEIYNGISPNGDGKNDTWIIEYIELFPDTKNNKVTLYNRWGDVVWEASNYDNVSVVFSGINKNGSELSTGSYFYKIEFEGDRKTITGYLSLKR